MRTKLQKINAPHLRLIKPGDPIDEMLGSIEYEQAAIAKDAVEAAKTHAAAHKASLAEAQSHALPDINSYKKEWQTFLCEGYADIHWMLHTTDGKSVPIYLGSHGDRRLSTEQVRDLQDRFGKGSLTPELQLEMLSELTQLCAIDSQLAVNLLPTGSKKLAETYPNPELLTQYNY